MDFPLKLPSSLAILFLLILCIGKGIFGANEEIQQISENVHNSLGEENVPTAEIPIKYEFTGPEAFRLLDFFLINLRPWRQRIPQELIEFMDGKLAKKSTNVEELEAKNEEENLGENEQKGGKEEFKFVGFVKKLFKIMKIRNKSQKGQKRLEKIKSKKEQNEEGNCLTCGQEREGVPKMGEIAPGNGELLVQQFSTPLNDLLASLMVQQPTDDILAKFEGEIEVGRKKGNYSEGAALALGEIVEMLRRRMKERLIPEGTLQIYYSHTILYQYFLNLFANFLKESKIKPGLFGNHPILLQPRIKDEFIENLLKEKPWEIVGKPQKIPQTDLDFDEFRKASVRQKQIQFLKNSEKTEDFEKLRQISQIGLEIGLKMFDKENVEIARQICGDLREILDNFNKFHPIFKSAIQKLASEFVEFPIRLENYEKANKTKNEQMQERVLSGGSDLSNSKELFGATKELHALNEEALSIEEDWAHLLGQVELMLGIFPKFGEILNSPRDKTLKKLDRMSAIGVEVIGIGMSKAYKMLGLGVALAYGNVLEAHLETLELDYERRKLKNVLEKVKELERGILEEKWYSKNDEKGKNGIMRLGDLDWPGMVKRVAELANWFHQSEQFRKLLEQENGLEKEIEVMENAIFEMGKSANEEEAKREAAIDGTLAKIEEEFGRIIEGNLDKKKVEVLKSVLAKIKIYKGQKAELVKEKEEILRNREEWQAKLVEAKKTPELGMVEEAELALKKYEAERQKLSNEYIQIIQKLEPITTAKNAEMQRIIKEKGLSRIERLMKIKRVLEKAKKANKYSLSQQSAFLNAQNKLIKELIERIGVQINAEEKWEIEKERTEVLHQNMLEKLNEKSQIVDKQVWGVKNHFMLKSLFGNEHYERIEEFNDKMETLAEFYGQIIWAIQKLSEELKAKMELVGILREREEKGGQQKWVKKDDEGMEMRYSWVLNGVQENQKDQRQILYEFFDNGQIMDLASHSQIKPIKGAEEGKIFERQLTLAESAIFIDWISRINFDLDLVNNPTGIIDILADKLNEVMAKLAENPYIQKKVEMDLLTDFAKNPVENGNPEEYYNRSIGRNKKEIEARIALRRVELIKKPLESAILMLIGMQKRFDEFSKQLTIPKQIEHQILFVDKPIKLTIPLDANQAASNGKFLLYSLYTFGECLIQEFKSNEKSVNRLLKLGLKRIREHQLMRNRLAMAPVEFRSVEFERRFNENFVENIFQKYAFDEIGPQQYGQEGEEGEGPMMREGTLGQKLWKDSMEKAEMEFKTNLRKAMCQFSQIQGDEENEENIQLMENTIKNIYYQPKMVKMGAPPAPNMGGLLAGWKKAKSSKIVFNPIRFLNGGAPLVVKSRLTKSIWRFYPDSVDNDFKPQIREYLIGMYGKKETSKLIDRFAKAYIVFPYQSKREGLQVALLLKEMLKLNNKKLNAAEEEENEGKIGKMLEAMNKAQKGEEEPQRFYTAAGNNEQNEISERRNSGNEKHGKMLEKISEEVSKRRRKREISQRNQRIGGGEGSKKEIIRNYGIDEFFGGYSSDDNSDEAKIPLKALPIYRLVKSLMMDEFNWQVDKNVRQIAPMMKASGFPGAAELELYVDQQLDFNKLTDELDQFCFIVAHSKRNVHMQIKVLYYRWKALKTILENGRRLTAFEAIIKILNANESPLQKFLYRLVDYTNYINQYTNGFQHVYGFTLKSLSEFLNRKMTMPGGSEFRIADLIVEDFVAENKLNELNKLMKMVEEIKLKTAGAKFVSLSEIRYSMQDVLQMRLNLLTEVVSKTREEEGEEENATTIELANNVNRPRKDWRLGRKEAEKHAALLKTAYSKKFHTLIGRLNNFWRHEERLRDYFCYDSCQGSAETAATKFDFTKLVFELQKALGIVESAITKYWQKIRLEEEKKKRKAEQMANKMKKEQEADNAVDFEKVKAELAKKRAEFVVRQKQETAYDEKGDPVKVNLEGEKAMENAKPNNGNGAQN